MEPATREELIDAILRMFHVNSRASDELRRLVGREHPYLLAYFDGTEKTASQQPITFWK